MSFISVVIPLYNKENFILNTVQSVLKQTFTDFELIIVEDCSTDRSLEIISKLKNDKIKIITHEKNSGLSASRNTGIKNANSKYVAFIDADDLWKENFLEEIVKLISTFPEAALFATNYEEIYADNKIILPQNNSNKFTEKSIIIDFFEANLSQPLYCASSLCVDKSIFKTIGFYNETINFGEDLDFNIRANSNFKLAYSNLSLVNYIMLSENQITKSKISDKIITNFDKYDNENTSKSLKKFLDFHRYIMAKFYKLEGNYEKFYKMKKGIDPSSLNKKQLLLLNLPTSILKFVNFIKSFFLKKGIRFTTYN